MPGTRLQSPPNWAPNGGQVIPAGTGFGGIPPVQVAGVRPGRQTIVIYNNGAGSAQAKAAPDQPGYITVAAGAVFNIDTEGAVFIASQAGTTIDVVETYWDPDRASRGEMPSIEHVVAAGPYGR